MGAMSLGETWLFSSFRPPRNCGVNRPMANTRTVTVINGDGIGPEVSAATIRVLEALKVPLEFEFKDAGAEVVAKFGTNLPHETVEAVLKSGVALKGPTGTVVGGGLPSANVGLRKRLDLYSSLRPVKSVPNVKTRYENVDLVVVRENTEGPYVGEGGVLRKGTPHEVATQGSVNTRHGVERCIRYAFEYARQFGRKKVTLVAKTNVLRFAHNLWQRAFEEVKAEYAGIETDTTTSMPARCTW